jgi:hypothetical protein
MLSYETIGEGYTPNSKVIDHVSLYMDVVQADHHIMFGLVLKVFSMCFRRAPLTWTRKPLRNSLPSALPIRTPCPERSTSARFDNILSTLG